MSAFSLESVGATPIATEGKGSVWFFGWLPRNPFVEAHLAGRRPPELFEAAGYRLLGSGKGKTVLLYEAVRKVWGQDLDPGPQLTGDCVSWGFAGCVDLVACGEVLAGEAESHSYDLRACTEVIYALSRVEYGDMDGSREPGSTGAWAADAVRLGGTLSRKLLGPYDVTRATEWGAEGLPDELEPTAKEHRIRKTAHVSKFEQARDAIANGYPVAVCSSRGFRMVRDEDGFAEAEGEWLHCMKFIATRDDRRPGLLCMNSWGAGAHTGPKGEHDIPDGSFWVDAKVCTQMLKEGEGYALSQFDGYPSRPQVLKALAR